MAGLKNSRMTDVGLLVLRVVLGLTFFFVHGGPKLLGGPEKWTGLGQAGMGVFGITFWPAFWGFIAALFETLGGLALALGLLTLPASLMILLVMIPATLLHLNAGEYAKAVYPVEIAAAALCLMFAGPGRYALSAFCGRGDKKAKPSEEAPPAAHEPSDRSE